MYVKVFWSKFSSSMKLQLKWVSWKCVISTHEKYILELLQFSLFHPRHCVLLRSTSCLLLPDDQAGNDGIIGIMTNIVFLITTKVLFFMMTKMIIFKILKRMFLIMAKIMLLMMLLTKTCSAGVPPPCRPFPPQPFSPSEPGPQPKYHHH